MADYVLALIWMIGSGRLAKLVKSQQLSFPIFTWGMKQERFGRI